MCLLPVASTSGRPCAVETICSGHSQHGGSGGGGTRSSHWHWQLFDGRVCAARMTDDIGMMASCSESTPCAASTNGRPCAVETICSGHNQRGGSGGGDTRSLPSVASRRHPGRRGRRRPGALPLACWMLDAPSRSTAAGCWRTTTARWPLTMKTTAAASTTRTTLS